MFVVEVTVQSLEEAKIIHELLDGHLCTVAPANLCTVTPINVDILDESGEVVG